jgi:hypothetical protein
VGVRRGYDLKEAGIAGRLAAARVAKIVDVQTEVGSSVDRIVRVQIRRYEKADGGIVQADLQKSLL